MHKKLFSRGFTIIELLVVIVVIGVLASVVAVAYSNTTQRTENQKTIAAANQAVKLMLIYKEQNNGNYPTYTADSYACIGTGYQDGVCIDESVGPNGITGREDAGFNAALKAIGGLPQPSTKYMTFSDGRIVAGVIYNGIVKGIWYYLQGNSQPCLLSGASAFNYGNVTNCRISLP